MKKCHERGFELIPVGRLVLPQSVDVEAIKAEARKAWGELSKAGLDTLEKCKVTSWTRTSKQR